MECIFLYTQYTARNRVPSVVFLGFLRVHLCLEDYKMTVCQEFGEAMENSSGSSSFASAREKRCGGQNRENLDPNYRISLLLHLLCASVIGGDATRAMWRGCRFPFLFYNPKAAFTPPPQAHMLSQWVVLLPEMFVVISVRAVCPKPLTVRARTEMR